MSRSISQSQIVEQESIPEKYLLLNKNHEIDVTIFGYNPNSNFSEA